MCVQLVPSLSCRPQQAHSDRPSTTGHAPATRGRFMPQTHAPPQRRPPMLKQAVALPEAAVRGASRTQPHRSLRCMLWTASPHCRIWDQDQGQLCIRRAWTPSAPTRRRGPCSHCYKRSHLERPVYILHPTLQPRAALAVRGAGVGVGPVAEQHPQAAAPLGHGGAHEAQLRPGRARPATAGPAAQVQLC